MKCKFLIVFTGFIFQDLSASSFFNEATRIMDSIPLIDGRTLLGRPIPWQMENIDLDNISQNVFPSLRIERVCNNMLENPIKSQGWVSDTYYTPDEFYATYKQLVHYSFLLNPSALCFYYHVLEGGNIYGLQIPGLKPQPERARLFKEVYDWTADIKKPPLFLERIRCACLNSETEVAAELKKHQAELDDQKRELFSSLEVKYVLKEAGNSTLRHRHIRDDANNSPTEREKLLTPQTLRVH